MVKQVKKRHFIDAVYGLTVLAVCMSMQIAAWAANQKNVVFLGDSLAVGYAMAAHPSMNAVSIAKNSTGLVNKRLRDWPSYIKSYCEFNRPSVLVVSLGANDIQNIGTSRIGSKEWAQKYEALFVEFIDNAAHCNAQIVLVEPPPFADAREVQLKEIRKVINGICGDGILCVKTSELLTDKEGRYIHSKIINGKHTNLRSKDGVHMTWHGYAYIAQEIQKTIINQGFNHGTNKEGIR